MMVDSSLENEGSFNLAGLVFGNIDNYGNYQGHLFPSEVKDHHVRSLTTSGCGPIIDDIIGKEEMKEDLYKDSFKDIKHPNAKDYSDIKLSEDESLDEDYDEENNNYGQFILPLPVPGSTEVINNTEDTNLGTPLAGVFYYAQVVGNTVVANLEAPPAGMFYYTEGIDNTEDINLEEPPAASFHYEEVTDTTKDTNLEAPVAETSHSPRSNNHSRHWTRQARLLKIPYHRRL